MSICRFGLDVWLDPGEGEVKEDLWGQQEGGGQEEDRGDSRTAGSTATASDPFSTTGGQLDIKMAPSSPGFTTNILVSVAEQSQAPRTPRKNKYLNILRHSKQPGLNWISLFYRLSLPKCQKSVGLGEPSRAQACHPPLGPAHPLRYQLTQSLPPSCLRSPRPRSCSGRRQPGPQRRRREPAATSGDDVIAPLGRKGL